MDSSAYASGSLRPEPECAAPDAILAHTARESGDRPEGSPARTSEPDLLDSATATAGSLLEGLVRLVVSAPLDLLRAALVGSPQTEHRGRAERLPCGRSRSSYRRRRESPAPRQHRRRLTPYTTNVMHAGEPHRSECCSTGGQGTELALGVVHQAHFTYPFQYP